MHLNYFDNFDEFANQYRDIHSKNIKISGKDSFYFAEMKINILTKFENNSNILLLDLGCGDGTTEIFIEQKFSSWKIEAIDISSKSIEIAKNKNLLNSIFQVYDGLNIPFNNDQFDIVFMAGVLHHISDELHNKLIKEIYRVLRTGGRLYIFEHNPLNPLTRYLVRTCIFDAHAKLLKSSYLKKILVKNKFKILKRQFIIFLPPKKIFSPFMFIEKYLFWLPLGGQYFFRVQKT